MSIKIFKREHRGSNFKGKNVTVISAIFTIGCCLAMLIQSSLVNVGPGHVGVLYKRFGKGTVVNSSLSEGTHFVAPWNRVYKYSIRIQQHSDDYHNILSSNGLSVTIHLTYRYKINKDCVGGLHKYLGSGYVETIIIPTVSSAVREIIGKYTPDHLYSTDRRKIQEEITLRITDIMGREEYLQYFSAGTVLVRGIELPDKINIAIQYKLTEEQELQRYIYTLKKEEKEAERKRTEAKGIADANAIINKSLTPLLLRYKWVRMKEGLAHSPNAKIVDVGSDVTLLINATKDN